MAYVALVFLAISSYLLTRLDKKNTRLLEIKVDEKIVEDARIVGVSKVASGLVGLLNHSELSPLSGLYLRGSSEVHTMGMLFPIDVVFLGKNGKVLKIEEIVEPGRKKMRGPDGTHSVLELAAGSATKNFGIFGGSFVKLNSIH